MDSLSLYSPDSPQVNVKQLYRHCTDVRRSCEIRWQLQNRLIGRMGFFNDGTFYVLVFHPLLTSVQEGLRAPWGDTKAKTNMFRAPLSVERM